MVALWQSGRRNLVKVEPFANRKRFLDREEPGTLAQRRHNCSLLGFISDNAEAQARLPLIMLLNEHHVPAAAAETIVEELRDNEHVIFLRRKSSWNTVDLMVWIMGVLRRRLAAMESFAHFVLLLDCAPVHTHTRVVQAATRNNIVLVFLAASMTASLQPLDIFVFSALKGYIKDAYERWMLREEGGTRTETFVSEILRTTDEYLFGRTWKSAFRGCGFGNRQSELANHLRARYPGIIQDGVPGSDLLTLQQLQACWPRRKDIPIGWLFSWVQDEDDPPPLPPPAHSPCLSAGRERKHPWHGRSRSSSSVDLSDPASVRADTSALPSGLAMRPSAASSSRDTWKPLRSLPKPYSVAPPAGVFGRAASSTERDPSLAELTPARPAAPPPPVRPPSQEPIAPRSQPQTPLPVRRFPIGRPLGLLRSRRHPQ